MESEEEETPVRKLSFDEVLQRIGNFGFYQKCLYFFLCIMTIFSSTLNLSFVFTTGIPKHRCKVPYCDVDPSPRYEDAFVNQSFAKFTYPLNTKGVYSECDLFEVISNDKRCSPSSFDSHQIINCSDWIFDKSILQNTVVTEFGLVCDRIDEGAFVSSIFYAGALFGSVPIGHLSDIFGRKLMYFISTAFMVFFGIFKVLISSYKMLLLSTFLLGFSQGGFFQLSFVLSMELVGKSKRIFCGVVMEYFFVIGEIILAIFAYYVQSWRAIILLSIFPLLAIGLCWNFILESPRWLISRKRYIEAEKVINKIASWNGTVAPDIEEYILEETELTESTEKSTAFLSSKVLIFRLSILFFSWFVVSMVYYGLNLNVTALDGSIYINFIYLSLFEAVGYFLCHSAIGKIGRKRTILISFLLCGISFVFSWLLSTSTQSLHTILFLLSKLGVTCVYSSIYIYTSELLPTSGRSLGVCLCSSVSKIGTIASPLISIAANACGSIVYPLAFGLCPIISGISMIFLPESLGHELPESVQEAEKIGYEEETEPLIS